jgi:hypothetical protein
MSHVSSVPSEPQEAHACPVLRLRSWWSAGSAVQSGVHLDTFLIRRLRDYEARCRHSHYPLLFEVAIVHGHLNRITNASYDTAWEQLRDDPTDGGTSGRFQSLSEIEEITRDQQELDEEDARLRSNLLSIREKQETLQDEVVDAIGTGRMPGPTTTSRRGRCRPRPRLSFPWMPVLGYTAIAAMTMVESYQLALPMLDSIGIDTTRLASAWTDNPLGVLGGAGFALAASAGLFFLWYLILRSAGALVRSVDSAAPGLIVRQGAGLFFLCCGLLTGTFVMANLRHGMTHDVTAFLGAPAMGNSVFLFLTLLVPFASAYIHHRIGQSACWQRRADSSAAQQQWQREEEERLVPAESLADRMSLIQQGRTWIEQQRTQLRTRRSRLADRAQTAQQQRVEQLEQARSSTEAYARTLLSALQQDRYYFLRQAHRSKALHLLSDEPQCHTQAGPASPRQSVRPLLTDRRNGHES